MGILLFIVIGFLAGLIARALMPGRQHMGFIATTLLGMAGSLVGGFVGSLIWSHGREGWLHPAGLIMSVVGAFIVLLIVGAATRRHTLA
jgi:uncharacterized membrane protein YeaQ/YmgE (transglycosylase-associated protein family)